MLESVHMQCKARVCFIIFLSAKKDVNLSIGPQSQTIKQCDANIPQGVTGLSLWVLACIMFVFSAVIAYTAILSKNLIRDIKFRSDVYHLYALST